MVGKSSGICSRVHCVLRRSRRGPVLLRTRCHVLPLHAISETLQRIERILDNENRDKLRMDLHLDIQTGGMLQLFANRARSLSET